MLLQRSAFSLPRLGKVLQVGMAEMRPTGMKLLCVFEPVSNSNTCPSLKVPQLGHSSTAFPIWRQVEDYCGMGVLMIADDFAEDAISAE